MTKKVIKKRLSERLNALVFEKKAKTGKNQSKQCDDMGINKGTFSKWLNAKATLLPEYDNLCMVCQYYGVSTDYLLGKSRWNNIWIETDEKNVFSLFPERLRFLRKSLDLSQDDFSVKLDVHREQIAYLEEGKRKPNLTTIINICQTFGVSADFLLGLNPELEKHFGKHCIEMYSQKINDILKTIKL